MIGNLFDLESTVFSFQVGVYFTSTKKLTSTRKIFKVIGCYFLKLHKIKNLEKFCQILIYKSLRSGE